MDLSIVIVSYNTRDMLRDCLRAIPQAVGDMLVEVFVVDNNSSDQSVGMVQTEFPEVHVIANNENAGFTRANNQALRLSVGRMVLLLNPDTEAEPGSLKLLVRFLEETHGAGACGPKLLNTDGTLQPSGRLFPTPWREFLGLIGIFSLNKSLFQKLEYGRDDFDIAAEVDEVSGACIMVRRDVMEKVGMLSEDFFMFFEETEWCRRIKQAGYKVFYVPEARVVHHWMGSVKQAPFDMNARLVRSRRTYFRKTAGIAEQAAMEIVTCLGIAKNVIWRLGSPIKRRFRALLRR